VSELLDYAEKVSLILRGPDKGIHLPAERGFKDQLKAIEALTIKKSLLLESPLVSLLDQLTSGFQASDLIIIAGRPAWAKPPFA